jgi:hypothetical protein
MGQIPNDIHPSNLSFDLFFSGNAGSIALPGENRVNDSNTLSNTQLDDFLNNIPDISSTLNHINEMLIMGGCLHCKLRTEAYFKKHYVKSQWGKFLYFFEFLFHRVLPKLHPLFHKIYYTCLKGKNQRLSLSEALGRLIKSGFRVQVISNKDGIVELKACKEKQPDLNPNFSYWPVFKMERAGKNGNKIKVYKLRTMHPFSEYVQDYIKQNNGIDLSGKFKNDFRVSLWGKVFRKYWIDEIPMIINLIRGDLKLIGVRPISYSYLKLYPAEFRHYRVCFKPGLIPPFYADNPGNFNEIVESEKRYLESYVKSPLKTDFIYFLKIIHSIFVKKARSR